LLHKKEMQVTAPTTAPELLSVRQIAEHYGLCQKTIYRYVAQGRLSARRVGPKLIRIPAEDAAALLSPGLND